MSTPRIVPLDDGVAPLVAEASPSWAAALPAWRESMAAGRSTLLVALTDTIAVEVAAGRGVPSGVRPAAVGIAQLLHEAVPEVRNVGVLESHRGRGIGTALMAEAERLAAPAGRMRLGVGIDNPSARRLYERLGYRPTGKVETTTYDFVDADGITRSATETDEWMEKELESR